MPNFLAGDGGAGFGMGSAGANLLPPAYTDKSLVRIPIKMSDVDPCDVKPVKKRGFFRRLSDGPNQGDEIKVVMMSRGDYLKYWAKGEDGRFLPSVEEPPEGRKEWVRKTLLLNLQWRKKEGASIGYGGNYNIAGMDAGMGGGLGA